jgi:hypothetical protein
MNAATLIATLLSLLLASVTAVNSTGNNPAMERPAPPGVNLNHNETLVHETAYQRPNAGRSWLTPEQAETVAAFLSQVSLIGTQCNPLTCGSNHNETFISDAR